MDAKQRRRQLRKAHDRASKRATNLDARSRSHADLPPGAVVMRNLGGMKMSEVLIEFAKPMLDQVSDFRAYTTAIHMAELAWNLAEAPSGERRKMLEDTVRSFSRPRLGGGGVSPEEVRNILEWLVHRKLQLFGHIHRLIADVKVSDRPDDYNVQVVSMPLTGSPEEAQAAAGLASMMGGAGG